MKVRFHGAIKRRGDRIPLSDEAGVAQVVAKSILELWDAVNELTRLAPPRRDRYRVSIVRLQRGLQCVTVCQVASSEGVLWRRP